MRRTTASPSRPECVPDAVPPARPVSPPLRGDADAVGSNNNTTTNDRVPTSGPTPESTMTTDHDVADRRLAALEVAALLHHCADLALVADQPRLRRALVYARRVLLELDHAAGAR